MNNKKYKSMGGATFLTFIVIVFLALWLTNRFQVKDQEMTNQRFVQEVKDKNVQDVIIKQNKTCLLYTSQPVCQIPTCCIMI